MGEIETGRMSRRRFLRGAGTTTIALSALGAPQTAAALLARRSGRTVAVLGGGVAGLTAAHELAERGFDVTVYEKRAWGGKARSFGVPDSAAGGRRGLPAEHSPHIILGCYQNLPDTLARIPFPGNADGVFGNLVPAPDLRFARIGAGDFTMSLGERKPSPAEPHIDPELELLAHLPPQDGLHFAQRLAVFLGSCDARRMGEWERTAWWDFLDADQRSSAFRELAVDFWTRELAAQDPRRASARSIASGVEALLYNTLGRMGTGPVSNVFALPKTEAWFDPWIEHLTRLGVRLRLGHAVTGLETSGGRMTRARMSCADGPYAIEPDWFVLALPVERARELWTPSILAADPGLGGMAKLPLWWSNAVQFYLDRPFPIVRGFSVFVDSPWALASISRAQFWRDDISARYGDGSVREVISVAISDFDTPGVKYGRPARELGQAQIAEEVWAQMQQHLEDPLPDNARVSWTIDPALHFDGAGTRIVANADPLVNQVAGSWANRPAAGTRIPNLLLAGDYVRGSVRVHDDGAGQRDGAASGQTRCSSVPDRRPLRAASTSSTARPSGSRSSGRTSSSTGSGCRRRSTRRH